MNKGDAQSSEDFYNDFTRLFRLTPKTATLSVVKNNFEDIKLFCIRFAHKVKELSGLQLIVPKLDSKNSRSLNHKELMRAFISIYPAYNHYCHSMREENRLYWDYCDDKVNY